MINNNDNDDDHVTNPQSSTASTKATRLSEKSLTASCTFADQVAACALQSYREHCPPHLQESLQQTVVAAMVLCDERDLGGNINNIDQQQSPTHQQQQRSSLRTLSLGVGTKFLEHGKFSFHQEENDENDAMENDDNNVDRKEMERINSSFGRRDLVRDMHAEVLARKAFQHLLLIHLQTQLSGKNENENSFLERSTHHTLNDDDDDDDDSSSIASNEYLKLAQGCSLHFYTSSAPCGNAVVRKWGTPKSGSSAKLKSSEISESGNKSQVANNVASSGFSSWTETLNTEKEIKSNFDFADHERLHVVQRSQGQVALLCKGNSSQLQKQQPEENIVVSSAISGGDNGKNQLLFPPIGTHVSTSSSETSIPCCSGKIAAWNFLQCWEGLLLRSLFSERKRNDAMMRTSESSETASLTLTSSFSSFSSFSSLVPQSIVIGRKFSQLHCQRALCCRVDLSRQILSKQDKKIHRDFLLLTSANNNNKNDVNSSIDTTFLVTSQHTLPSDITIKMTATEAKDDNDDDEGQFRRRQRDGETKEQSHDFNQQQNDTKASSSSSSSPFLHDALPSVHHPVLLSTSVKLDETVRQSAELANFRETRCFWWNSSGASEILCGKTGMMIINKTDNDDDDDDGHSSDALAVSDISIDKYLAKCKKLGLIQTEKEEKPQDDSIVDVAKALLHKDRSIHLLTNHPLLFSTWPRCDLLETFL